MCNIKRRTFLARTNVGDVVGCIAVRQLSNSVCNMCNMNRLWARHSVKGLSLSLGLGQAYVTAVIDAE